MAYYDGNNYKYNNSYGLNKSVSQIVVSDAEKPSFLSTTKTSDNFAFTFELNSGASRTFTLQSPKGDITDDLIKEAAQKILENGFAFLDAPYKLLGAKSTQRTTITYDV